MNTFVSGESDAKGLSVILPYIAVGPAAVAIRRPELWERLEYGTARLGWARHGMAGHGMESGGARRGRAGPGAARQRKSWNMGGHIRKNNKPTQTQWNKHTATHS